MDHRESRLWDYYFNPLDLKSKHEIQKKRYKFDNGQNYMRKQYLLSGDTICYENSGIKMCQDFIDEAREYYDICSKK
jgi:hypothetical protein